MPKLCRIAGDHPNRSLQLPAIIPVPWPPKRAEQLMRMRLEDHCTRANHFSPLPPLISRRADLIEPPMGSRQGVHLWQRTLTSGLPCSIHIDHQPLCPLPVEQA